jgi:hypothetical protein
MTWGVTIFVYPWIFYERIFYERIFYERLNINLSVLQLSYIEQKECLEMPKKVTKQDVVGAASRWMKEHPKEFKELVSQSIDAYCTRKASGAARGERQNATRDIENAQVLQKKINQDDFGALLNLVQGKGRLFGPSQRPESLMHLISQAVFTKIKSEKVGNEIMNSGAVFKVRDGRVGVLVTAEGHLSRNTVDITAKDFLIEGVKALANDQLESTDTARQSVGATTEMQSMKAAVQAVRKEGQSTEPNSSASEGEEEDKEEGHDLSSTL